MLHILCIFIILCNLNTMGFLVGYSIHLDLKYIPLKHILGRKYQSPNAQILEYSLGC